MFHQVLNPTGNLGLTVLAALIPVIVLLVMLAVFRITAWLATLIGSILTLIVAIALWHLPLSNGIQSYLIGSANGIWAVDWITFWGVVIFNTLKLTGLFDTFKNWLIEQATADVRVQAILLAWALGALLEGLVGFGYPWAVVAPILVVLGVAELDALRVAAIANNAPVSYGALGAPIIALAAVTSLPLLALSASVGKIVAVLALLPPWVLIYLVAGRKGFREGWPLAIVGSLAYILGQLPVSQFLGPYLPDVVGALVCFGALLLLLKVWRPRTVLGYGGVELSEEEQEAQRAASIGSSTSSHSVLAAWLPFLILIVVVVLWTGPWSPLPKIVAPSLKVTAVSSISNKVTSVAFAYAPFIGGTAILASWLVMLLFIRPGAALLGQVFWDTFRQMWERCWSASSSSAWRSSSTTPAWARHWPMAFRRSAPLSSCSPPFWDGSAWRSRAAIPPPTVCLAWCRCRWAGCWVSLCCCCPRWARREPRSASRSLHRRPAWVSQPPSSCATRGRLFAIIWGGLWSC